MRKTEICIGDLGYRSADPFKGQRDLSLRNDFNLAVAETARIATPSQQIGLGRGPNKFAGVRNNPPTMLGPGGRGAERHRISNLNYIYNMC